MVDIVSADEYMEAEKARKRAHIGVEGVSGKGDTTRRGGREKYRKNYDKVFRKGNDNGKLA